MKKFTVCIVWLIGFLMSSCSSEYSVDGFANFQREYHSHYELNYYILPSEDFADRYQYVDIDYHYYDKYKTIANYVEKSLVSISYEQGTYEQAKEYCLKNMQLSDSNTVTYEDYRFVENVALAKEQGRSNNSFPHWFNMFAYNDRLKQLVFMGFYSPNYTSADAQNVLQNWDDFLVEHFPHSWTGIDFSGAEGGSIIS